MRLTRRFTLLAGAAALTACSRDPKFRSYYGPEVTHVVVNKGERRMFLLHEDRLLEHYRVDLGFAPEGHKRFEGDGRTPEGRYVIDRRNPESSFHLSLGISYPNERDIAYALSHGKSPGGDIFIHGGPRRHDRRGPDWTAGCISVRDREMEDVYAMVRNGTPITITA